MPYSSSRAAVRALMVESKCWWTPAELQKAIRYLNGKMVSDAALTARIRDLRKPQFGGFSIASRPREGRDSWEYKWMS